MAVAWKRRSRLTGQTDVGVRTAAGGPMLQGLRGGANETEIGKFLQQEVEEHFSLDPLGARPEAMAIRVIAWWAAVGIANGNSA